MVRKATTTVATRAPKGAVNNWEAEMEQDAVLGAEAEALSNGGQFIGLAAGVLAYNGNPMPNNEMRCVILDSIFENVFYEGEYESGNPTAPRCFAYGRYDKDGKTVIGIDTKDGEREMAPHKTVLKPVCDTCAECPNNQFGSAATGRGKACKNTRRLALIPVQGAMKKGQFIINTVDTEHYVSAAMAYLKTPVTSTKIFSGYVQQVASSLKRPTYGIFTRVFTVPDTDKQFTVNFEVVDSVPATLGRIIMDRVAEARAAIAFPYTQHVDETPKKGGSTKGKPAPAKGKKETAPRARY